MVPINNNKLSKAKLLEELEKLNKKIASGTKPGKARFFLLKVKVITAR
jgi:hypothetical protein